MLRFFFLPILLPLVTCGVLETDDELVLDYSKSITLRFEFGIYHTTPPASKNWSNCSICVDCDIPLEKRPLNKKVFSAPFEPCPGSIELFTKLELKELSRVAKEDAETWMSVYTEISNDRKVLQISRSVTSTDKSITRETFHDHGIDAAETELVLEAVENERHFPPNDKATWDPEREANWLEFSWDPKTVEKRFITGKRKGLHNFKVLDYQTSAKLKDGVEVKDVIRNLAELSFLQAEGCICVKKNVMKKQRFHNFESLIELCRDSLTTEREDHKAAVRLFHTCLTNEEFEDLWPVEEHPFYDHNEL